MPQATLDHLADTLSAFDARMGQVGRVNLAAFEQASVASPRGCQIFAVGREGGVHDGILALYDTSGMLRQWWPFNEATHLQVVDGRHIAFEYLEGAGSGTLDEKLVVFCQYPPDYWVHCLEENIHHEEYAVPAGVRGATPQLTQESRATYAFRQDMLLLRRHSTWESLNAADSTVAKGVMHDYLLRIPLP